MKLYNISDLYKGAGAFDFVMHDLDGYPSDYAGMSPAVAIGFLGAAMHSGLRSSEITDVIDQCIPSDDRDIMMQIRKMYNGTKSSIHLWSEKGEKSMPYGQYLHFARPEWRYLRPEEEIMFS